MIRFGSETRVYLNIKLLEAPPHPEYAKRSSLDLIINDEVMTVHPYILKGGQRLLFPGEIKTLLIERLIEGACLKIRMGQRDFTIITDGFKEAYESFTSLPQKT